IDGKKQGIIKLEKVRGGKAIAVLVKGRAAVDGIVERPAPKGGAQAAAAPAESSEEAAPTKSKKKGHDGTPATIVGAVVGYGMDSQSVKESTSSTISMTGNGFSLKAIGDIPISGDIAMIARAGIEQMSLKGKKAAGGDAKTEIMYG